MESKKLHAEQIVAGSDAGWEVEVVPAVALNHAVNGPCRASQPIFGYFEPAETGGSGAGSVVDFCEPVADGTCEYRKVSQRTSILVAVLYDLCDSPRWGGQDRWNPEVLR